MTTQLPQPPFVAPRPATVPAWLCERAERPGSKPYATLIDDAGHEEILAHATLWAGAQRVAAGLQARGVGRGDRVVLVLPTGRAFLETFFGVMLAGAVAVPVYPPARTKGVEGYQAQLAQLLAVAAPRLVVTFERVKLVVEATAFQARRAEPSAPVVLASALTAADTPFAPVALGADDVALVQFSSGSTAAPRGVELTHGALLADVESILAVSELRDDDVMVSWLPLYHDMGLVGGLLFPLVGGLPLVLMSSQAFLLDVKRWLWAIHRHRGTLTMAPNFAYQLVASRLQDAELEGLDLSCVRVSLNGAEPITEATVQAFNARLAPYGWREAALTPVYGLAEVVVGACFSPLERPALADRVDREHLASASEALPASAQATSEPAVFYSVGSPLPGFSLRIVQDGEVQGERRVGEIQLRGPSMMRGYLGDEAATAAAFDDGWLRTGDLGYLAEGELFIVGRAKDLILKAGRNYVPQDLERAAEGVDGVRAGCVAAFGVENPATGTEDVVVVVETREPPEAHAALARAVGEAVGRAIGLKPDRVHCVAPGALPKTSSGKLQRRKSRERFLADAFTAPREPGLWQKTRLVGQALAQRLTTPDRIAKAP